PETAPLLYPQMWIGREVIHFLAAFHRAFDGRSIADVGKNQFDAIQGQMSDRRTRQVENPHPLAAFDEQTYKMAADEAGASGDKDHRAVSIQILVRAACHARLFGN